MKNECDQQLTTEGIAGGACAGESCLAGVRASQQPGDPESGAAYIFELDRCGDINEDGVIDLSNFDRFHECLTGPGFAVRVSCESADLDRDIDADLHDYTLLTHSLP